MTDSMNTNTPDTTTTSQGLSWRTFPTSAKVALISVALGFVIRFRTVTVHNGDCSSSEPTAVIFGAAAIVAGLVALGQGVRRRSLPLIAIALASVAAGVLLVLRGVGTLSSACG